MPIGKRIISTLLAASMLTSIEAQVVDYGLDHGVFSFEENTKQISTSKHSEIAITGEHAKLGQRSLSWSWKKAGSSISICAPIPYLHENPDPKETSVSSFVFWVYSPESLSGSLRFSFLKDGRECCHFDYTLGFEGWRGAWVAFDRDMEGNPEPEMDCVRITVSDNLKKGRLYFDGIITASFQDVRYHTADWQARFINAQTTSFWLTLNKFWDNRFDFQVNDSITPEEIADLKTIEERFTTLVTDNVKRWSLDEIREFHDSYGLRKNPDGTITGKPIWFIRYGETYLNQGIPDAMKSFKAARQTLQQLNDGMLRIAVSYMQEENPEARKEIAGIYVALTHHLLDQGFAAGSGQGTLHHLGYSMRNFYTGPIIMKNVLREAGLADDMQRAMEWFCGVGEVKTAPEVPGMDIDAFNTSLMGRFASVLMLEDTPHKQAYMKALSRWVDNGFKHTEGLRPCFKRDGCVVHHRKCYPEYAVGGFKGSVNAIWMLSRTAFAVSEESHRNQKEALLTMRFFSNTKNFPVAMSGRHPDGTRSLIPAQFAILADAGTPDGTEAVDRELASAYLRLNGNSGKWAEKFTRLGISAEKAPVGGKNLAYNCSLSYRQDDWLLTFAGHSRYLWAAETYRGENLYGRYLTHGSMQYLNEGGCLGSGFRMEGWDWCHIPGTTAAEIPMEKMKADILNVDEFSGYEEMLLSDEWFAGGVSFGKEAAAYAMKLHEHDKYNGSLRAHKSFFAFGNRIVCLGSNLENTLEGSELHTTIFQNSAAECTTETMTSTSGPAVLADNQGNAYFVSDSEICLSRGLQHSLHEETDAPTQGYFEKAYINHGTPENTKNDSYEYLMVVKASDKDMEEFGMTPPYQVLRADSTAHIVKDLRSGITGCSIFMDSPVDETITSASPSLLMYRYGDGKLELSISNPDLALYAGEADDLYDKEGKRVERSVYGRSWIENPAGSTTIELTLEGSWKIDAHGDTQVDAKTDQRHTIVSITTSECRTEHITLSKIE